jgi:hypothetical protein
MSLKRKGISFGGIEFVKASRVLKVITTRRRAVPRVRINGLIIGAAKVVNLFERMGTPTFQRKSRKGSVLLVLLPLGGGIMSLKSATSKPLI